MTDVLPGGPAQKAGLQSGDVVVAVNGVPVKSNTEMTREVAKSQAGDVIHLDVFRDGKERTVDVQLRHPAVRAELAQNGGGPRDDQGGGGAPDHPAALGAPVLGMQVAPLNASTRGQFNIPDTVKGGVVVPSVKGTSDAGDKGLQRGRRDRPGRRPRSRQRRRSAPRPSPSGRRPAARSSRSRVRRDGQMLGFVPIKIDG